MTSRSRAITAECIETTENSPPSYITPASLLLVISLLALSVMSPESFMAVITSANHAFLLIARDVVVTISSMILLGALVIVFTPLGNMRLGMSAPEFSTLSWLAMLFATGMGSGLLYWAVAEPVIHLSAPPLYNDAMMQAGNARMAMVISYLHWAFHPWGIYAAGSLCIAYFSFCRGFPLLPGAPFRSALSGRFRYANQLGDAVDVICVVSTLQGMAAALAAGTMQIASGMKWLGFAPEGGSTFPTYSVIIGLLASAYLASAATPIGKGIKRLSELNMLMAVLLLVIVACFTPVAYASGALLQRVVQSVADYLHFLPDLAFSPLTSETQSNWGSLWTANYFLSWVSWMPFVGIFVARISKGRSLREFMLGVILAPSLFTFLWFSIFGHIAMDVQLSGVRDLAADILADTGAGLFSLLSLLPHAEWLWAFVIALVFIFLVTSTDSASYVLAMMAERGENNPSVKSKMFWGISIAVFTLVPLFTDGGIHSVRAMFSFAGIAVFFVLIGQVYCFGLSLLKNAKHDKNNAFM